MSFIFKWIHVSPLCLALKIKHNHRDDGAVLMSTISNPSIYEANEKIIKYIPGVEIPTLSKTCVNIRATQMI